ncbi:MAG: hypothetical protein U0518_02545 [Candidatus Gracilibacteria bacterium]
MSEHVVDHHHTETHQAKDETFVDHSQLHETHEEGHVSSHDDTHAHGKWNFRTEVAYPAWEFSATSIGNTAKKFNYFPSLIAAVYLAAVLFYQLFSTYSVIFGKGNQIIGIILQFFHSITVWEILSTVVIFYCLMLFFGPIAHAGVISLIDSEEHKHHQSATKALGIGLSHFFDLFELHNLVGIFNLLSVITFYAFLLRLFDFSYIVPISWFIFIYFILANIANMLFSYAPYHIVFGKKTSFQALTASAIQAITHLDVTLKVYLNYLIVSVRTIFIGIIILLIPFLASWLIGWFGFEPDISTIFLVITILTAPFILFLAQVNSVLEIFLIGLWYRAYHLTNDSHGGASTDHHHHDDHHH